MSTEARIESSRANGAKSRGPITPEGKAVSSRNAVRHGLMSSTILIDGELPERFETLLASHVAEFQPENETEMMLVENMAVCKWRQLRIWALENVGHSEEIRRLIADSPEMASKDPAERAWWAMREIMKKSNILDLMNRYETRFDRQYTRALRTLRELRPQKQ